MKQQVAFFSWAVVALLLPLSAVVAQAQSETPNAGELLKQMAAKYAGASTYRDTTAVRYLNLDGSERFQVEFKIWFARPSRIRLDALSKREGALPRREVLWSDAATTRMWSTGKAVVANAQVKIAGSGMFGTYAYHVPTLLEESYATTRRLHELTDPVMAGEENFEGVDCYRITGDWNGDAYQIWLGKEDQLVRKIAARYRDHQLEEVHRDIAIDVPLEPAVFRFAPEDEEAPVKPAATASPKASPKKPRS